MYRPQETTDRPAEKRHTPALLLILLCLAFILPAGMFEKGYDVTRYTISSEKLPTAFDGLTILQISDLHWPTYNDNMRLLLDTVRRLSPDVIALTGDIIDENSADFEGLSGFLASLRKLSVVYAVSGNHDRWGTGTGYKTLIGLLEKASVEFLDDRSIRLERNGSYITFHGVKDPESWSDNPPSDILDESFATISPAEGFNVLLFHRANLAELLVGRGYDLILTGHMHGGIVRIPFIGGVASPYGTLFPKYTAGRHDFGDETVIVNRGIGEVKVFPRVFNRPEVGLITLKTTPET